MWKRKLIYLVRIIKLNALAAKRNNKKGFTLIELVVVIAVIALLASMILVSLNKARVKARDARRKQDLDILKTAMQLYANDHQGAYYPSGGAVFSCYPGPAPPAYDDWPASFQSEMAPYLSALPKDPLNNRVYCYAVAKMLNPSSPSCNGKFVIGAHLEATDDQDYGKYTCNLGSDWYFPYLNP